MKRKILIAIICVVIVICIILLLLYLGNRSNVAEGSNNINNVADINTANYSERIKDHSEFSTVQNAINKYEAYLNLNYEEQLDELNYPSLAAMYGITAEEEKKQAILDFLDRDYVLQNNITLENIYDYVDESENQNLQVTALEINRILNIENSGNISIYNVYAQKEDENGEKVCDKYYIVKMDSNNETFCIYESDEEEYNNDREIALSNNTTSIEKNNRNAYIEYTMNDAQIATSYFQQFKNLLINNAEKAYQELGEDYRNTRFGTLDNFLKFVDKNIEEIRLMQLYDYSVESSEDYVQYVMKDQYENTYIFIEYAPNDYDVQLDTYTILSDNFKSAYDKADVQGKTMLNSDKWIQMLNNRDYTSAYNVLDETFRNNNFGTVDNFENYMRQNYGEHYDVDFGDFSNEGDTYIQTLTLTTISGSGKNKEITIIMRLNENYGFTMSFVV